MGYPSPKYTAESKQGTVRLCCEIRAREREAFKSERSLRQRIAVGARVERAKLALTLAHEGALAISEMCSAHGVIRRGCHVWKRRPPSAYDLHDGELAHEIGEAHEHGCGHSAPQRCSRSSKGRRAPPASAWRIMHENGCVETTSAFRCQSAQKTARYHRA